MPIGAVQNQSIRQRARGPGAPAKAQTQPPEILGDLNLENPRKRPKRRDSEEESSMKTHFVLQRYARGRKFSSPRPAFRSGHQQAPPTF